MAGDCFFAPDVSETGFVTAFIGGALGFVGGDFILSAPGLVEAVDLETECLPPEGFAVLVDFRPANVVGLAGALEVMGLPLLPELILDTGLVLLECKLLTKGLALRLDIELTDVLGLELTEVFT